MSNKTCLSCNKIFKYPYLLKRHQDGVYGCEDKNIEILENDNKKELNNSNSVINNDIINAKQDKIKNQCIKCKEIFKHRQILYRHKKICNYKQQATVSTEKNILLSLQLSISQQISQEISQEILKLPEIQELKKQKEEIQKQKEEIQKLQKEEIQKEKKELQLLRKQNEELKKTQKQIQLQNEELQKLQQDKYQTNTLPIENKDKFTTNFIYLIIEKEYITNNEDIFKIGKTTQKRLKRFDKYKSGSILLSYNRCTDCHKSEKEIIKFFKIKYKQRLDIGLEYFEGNHEDMIDDIYSIIKFNKARN